MNDMRIPQQENEHSLREIVDQYTRFWYLFVLCVILAMVGAYIYLTYSTTYYMSSATVIIKDEKSGGATELAAFSDLGGFLNRYGSNKIENELAVFRSKRIIREAVERLNLNIIYESVGTFKDGELYAYKPFVVQYLTFNDSTKSKQAPTLYFRSSFLLLSSRLKAHLELSIALIVLVRKWYCPLERLPYCPFWIIGKDLRILSGKRSL